jgi:hypothetical protein
MADDVDSLRPDPACRDETSHFQGRTRLSGEFALPLGMLAACDYRYSYRGEFA